jgi:HSP20 family molecular chaperone IbpA
MKVDVRDEDGRYVLEAEMPGMSKDNVKVEVEDGVLTISASYDDSRDKEEEGKYVYRERYPREIVPPIENTVIQFCKFLEKQNLINTFFEKWRINS